MGGHFAALVVSQGQTFLGFDAVEHMTKTVESGFGPGVVHFGQRGEQGGALHQSAHRGTVIGSFDQVAFPVSRDQPFIDFRWPIMNTDHLRNLTTAILASYPRTAFVMPETQPADHFAALTRHGAWHRWRCKWFHAKPATKACLDAQGPVCQQSSGE